ncbi:MAG: hypothetical protein NVSMB56_19510 [Pyrinomonadaceae bacterium]
MPLLNGLLEKLRLRPKTPLRDPLYIFVLDDDVLRQQWFIKQFEGNLIDVAADVEKAIELLSSNQYDTIFLDHDLLPEHYESSIQDDERTGYALAFWLAAHPDVQPSSNITVHTRNANGAIRMVNILRLGGRDAEYVPYPLLIQKIKKYK